MRVAPLALHYKPESAADQARLDMDGAEIAAITHGHPLGYLPAAILTHIISIGVYGGGKLLLREAVDEAWTAVRNMFTDTVPARDLNTMECLITKAKELAVTEGSDEEHIRAIGDGWSGDEALAIAIYCSLRYPDNFSKAVIAAVNHSGDSDSTGAVTGNILGSWLGYEAIEEKWKTNLEMKGLLLEMAECRSCFPGKTLHTVYIGGGTPTTLSPAQLDRFLSAVEKHFDLSHVMEFTLEAGRPDSITREKLEAIRTHPVTRISVNPQTMNQKTLDLIVGLPGEGLEEVRHTMERIEALDPDDVTVHALALKRAARLALHMDEYEKISFQASDRIMNLCEEGCRRLNMTPYYLYRQKNMAGNFENVGYAKPDKAGLYNILIMEEVECILALGAAGSTKIVYEDGRIERVENVKDIRNYLERIDEMIRRKRAVCGCEEDMVHG